MFGKPLPPPSFSAASGSSSARGKAASQVPMEWVDTVTKLQECQSASKIVCMSGYLVQVLTGEAFKSESNTLCIVIDHSTWLDFATKWFPELVAVSLDDLDSYVKSAPFKFPVRRWDDSSVQLNIKIHNSIFKESLPDGLPANTILTVNFCFIFFVYSSFGNVPTPGCSLKCGWIQKA